MRGRPPKPPDRQAAPRFRKPRGSASASSLGSLRRLTRLTAGLDVFLPELASASDRNVAIFMAANVERELEALLLAAVLKRSDNETKDRLLDRDGALATFYGNIHLGYALELYNKETLSNLDRIRNLRNTFAHAAIPLRFDHRRVASECARLTLAQTGIESFHDNLDDRFNSPRDRFIAVCFQSMITLIMALRSVMENDLKRWTMPDT